MNRERGGGPSRRSGGWGVLPCRRRGLVTASPGVKALPDAHHATFQGRFRSISPARRQGPGSRAQYKLHSQDVRDSVRGSSNHALKRTAASSGVHLRVGCAAA
jgi:hypothetical protein